MFQIFAIGVPLSAAVAQVVAALVVLASARDRRVARSFTALAICLTAWNLRNGLEAIPTLREVYETELELLIFAFLFIPATVFHLAVRFSGIDSRAVRIAVWLGYLVSCFFCILQSKNLLYAGFVSLPWATLGRPGPLLPIFVGYVVTSLALSNGMCAYALKNAQTPEIALRAKYWLLAFLGVAPLTLTNFLVSYGLPIFPLGSTASMVSLLILAYAAARYRLIEINVLILKVAATSVAVLLVAVPVLAAVYISLQLPVGVGVTFLLGTSGLVLTTLAYTFKGLRSLVESGFEGSLFPRRRNARQALKRFSEEVVSLLGDSELSSRLVAVLTESLNVRTAALYIATSRKGHFRKCALSGATEAPDSLTLLSDGRVLMAASTDWELCLPVPGQGKPLAIIALGPKTSGAAIDDSDRTLLSMVAAQLAVALKNAEYVGKIEQQKEQIDELRKRVEAENIVLRAEVRTNSQFKEIIGSSASLRHTLDRVAKVAPTDASILITGETGTGKELVARALHELSPRSSGPLICVNCPAIPVDIAESELFGCERGAFTGATEARPGKFEMAHGGTIFLDEVGDLPPNVQVKLLRVLQERQVQRLGSHKVRTVDVRIVSATNRDLQVDIRQGRFREDLYFRLASVPVHIPPLRDRIGDIHLLAAFFLKRAATQYQKPITGLTPDALNALTSYSWPGNIRELQHVIERAVLLCTSNVLHAEHLSDLAAGVDTTPPPATLGAAIREEKLRRVREALLQTGGNQAAAARLLGMSRSNLARLIKRYGIDPLDSTH